MARPRLLLLCGGQSAEHEVSLSSARSVLQAVSDSFEVTPFVIDRSGRLLDAGGSRQALEAGAAPEGSGGHELASLGVQQDGFDVVFPLLHGPNGEDGSVQGLLKLAGIPFVGSDILGSAVGMDKLMMKAVLETAGLPQVQFHGVFRRDWLDQRDSVLKSFSAAPLPLFIKPANLGSSVGISKVSQLEHLAAAFDAAFRHDRRVIVEQGLDRVRELEIAVLGNENPEVSPVGEIVFDGEFYDYDTKYQAGRADLRIPADISPETAQRCRTLALQAFRELDLAGLARIDFFLTEENELYLNEVNTMPGFTETSMYPRLWQTAGVSYSELVTKLVALALERHPPAQ